MSQENQVICPDYVANPLGCCIPTSGMANAASQDIAVERLPAVSDADLLANCETNLPVPKWLRQLHLQTPRTNICCLRPRTRLAKRVLDICVASLLLVITAPLMLIAAVLIRLTSPGPVFFVQTRVGLNARRGDSSSHPGDRRQSSNFGRPFKIFKLRPMRVDADRHGPTQAKAGDNRVTTVGKFLRQMRIDELPQLVNVLRGEMSMVGPRPECIEYMEELSEKVPNYLERLGLKPGLTGIAQIEAGYANDLQSYRRKVAYDLIYLQNCCVTNDIRVMLRTIRVVLTGFGAL